MQYNMTAVDMKTACEDDERRGARGWERPNGPGLCWGLTYDELVLDESTIRKFQRWSAEGSFFRRCDDHIASFFRPEGGDIDGVGYGDNPMLAVVFFHATLMMQKYLAEDIPLDLYSTGLLPVRAYSKRVLLAACLDTAMVWDRG